MNILFGHYVADEGTIAVAGPDGSLDPLTPGSPRAALTAGIGMVHQHFALAESLTVIENVVLGTERLLAPRLKLRAARRKLERLMAESGLAIAPDAPRVEAFRRREAASRDPEGALPRRPHPDPRRADRRADAAGGRSGCSRCCADWREAVSRSSSSRTSSARCWRSPIGWRCCGTGGRSQTSRSRKPTGAPSQP